MVQYSILFFVTPNLQAYKGSSTPYQDSIKVLIWPSQDDFGVLGLISYQ